MKRAPLAAGAGRGGGCRLQTRRATKRNGRKRGSGPASAAPSERASAVQPRVAMCEVCALRGASSTRSTARATCHTLYIYIFYILSSIAGPSNSPFTETTLTHSRLFHLYYRTLDYVGILLARLSYGTFFFSGCCCFTHVCHQPAVLWSDWPSASRLPIDRGAVC